MPDPVDPGERKPLLSLGHSFERDVKQHVAPRDDLHNVGKGKTADEIMRDRAAVYGLSLGRFWGEQRAAFAAAPAAQDAGQQAQVAALNKTLDAAGVGDAAFTQLLDNWERVTSPYDADYDSDVILAAGRALRTAVQTIRGVVDKLPMGDPIGAGLTQLLTGISAQIGARARGLGQGKVVVPASAENRARELVKRVAVVAAAGRDPIAAELQRQQDIIAKEQKQLADLPGRIAAATTHVDDAGRAQAEQDLATVTQRLKDPATSADDKPALLKRRHDLTDFISHQDASRNRVAALNQQIPDRQKLLAAATASLGPAQTRVQAFDRDVANQAAALHSGTPTSRNLLSGATTQLYSELDAFLKPDTAKAAKASLKSAFGAAGVDGQLKQLASQLSKSTYTADAIADICSKISANIQSCIVATDALVTAVPKGEVGMAALRAAARDKYVAALTAVAGDVRAHFSYLVDKGFFQEPATVA